MKRFLAIVAASVAMTVAAAPANAQTMIGKGDSFLLGGEQTSPMRVTGRNVGNVPIEIMAELGGKRTPIITVRPGDGFDHVFAPREIAVLRNTSSTREAAAKIGLNKQLYNLSMRYQLPQR